MGEIVETKVVTLTEVEPGIAQITMQDRLAKNAFSSELIQGLVDAFASVARMPGCKVVVVTGYDTYFCSGGTRDALEYLHLGKGSFADVQIYGAPVECPVPVVSAMQGHAVGGGLVFGLAADFAVFSAESVYTANFMKYGFTPGMGATLILPERLGFPLAHEMLLTARTYRGTDLKSRGISFPVVPRSEVLPLAYKLAREMVDKPLHSLMTLKAHMVRNLRQGLPEVIRREMQMHEDTIHHPEVLHRINTLFHS
jgi:polyketide biosynthesis enoyl-CoA hydratase PksI